MRTRIQLIALSLFIATSFVACDTNEKKDLLPPPPPVEIDKEYISLTEGDVDFVNITKSHDGDVTKFSVSSDDASIATGNPEINTTDDRLQVRVIAKSPGQTTLHLIEKSKDNQPVQIQVTVKRRENN